MLRREPGWSDSGWIGAGAEDDLDQRLAAEEEPFDHAQPHVMTLLGPVAPDDLGVTLFDAPLAGAESLGRLDDQGLPDETLLATADQLRLYHDAGGRALVTTAPPGDDRDRAARQWLAAWTPIHLIPVTEPRAGTSSTRHLTGMVDHVTGGIAGSPGLTSAIHVALPNPTGVATGDAPLASAAFAATATGAPLLLDIADPVSALPALALPRNHGVETSRVTVIPRVAHLDADAARALLATGATLALTLTPPISAETTRQTGMIRDLVSAGYGQHLVLAVSRAARSVSGSGGSPGWATILERVPLALMAAGLEAADVRRLMIDNPARALTIRRGEDE